MEEKNHKCPSCGDVFSRRTNLHRHQRQTHRTNFDDDTSSSVTSVSSTAESPTASADEKLSKIVQKSTGYKDFIDRLQRCIEGELSARLADGLCSHHALSVLCKEIKQNVEFGSKNPIAEGVASFEAQLKGLYLVKGGKEEQEETYEYVVAENNVDNLTGARFPSKPSGGYYIQRVPIRR
jgi:hypothetical protein